MCDKISKDKEGEDDKELLSQLKQLQKSTNKIKIALIRAGQKTSMEDWLASLRRL